MIGPNYYWSTGITVHRMPGPRDIWKGEVEFYDDGFCNGTSTEGKLTCRYYGPLHQVVDTVKADAERLGIVFRTAGEAPPRIYYKGDGENPNYPPPAGWRLRLEATARRLGWRSLYAPKEAA